MEISDFSNNFDVLLNSYAASANFGSTDNPITIELDEYEKSVFLTKAQEEIVTSLYTGRNNTGKGFEETEELRRYLANLIEVAEIEPEDTDNNDKLPPAIGDKSYFFILPENLWFITYESVSATRSGTEACGNECNIDVIPIKQDEYHRIKKNPFRGANDRRALRLDLSDGIVEIICKYTITKYYLRYLRKLQPLILSDLGDGLEINGESTASQGCELDSSLHQKVLERAVSLALASRGIYQKEQNN